MLKMTYTLRNYTFAPFPLGVYMCSPRLHHPDDMEGLGITMRVHFSLRKGSCGLYRPNFIHLVFFYLRVSIEDYSEIYGDENVMNVK